MCVCVCLHVLTSLGVDIYVCYVQKTLPQWLLIVLIAADATKQQPTMPN